VHAANAKCNRTLGDQASTRISRPIAMMARPPTTSTPSGRQETVTSSIILGGSEDTTCSGILEGAAVRAASGNTSQRLVTPSHRSDETVEACPQVRAADHPSRPENTMGAAVHAERVRQGCDRLPIGPVAATPHEVAINRRGGMGLGGGSSAAGSCWTAHNHSLPLKTACSSERARARALHFRPACS
jgi:hypothetical protein